MLPPMGIMMTSDFIFIQMLIVYSYSIHIASRAASADKSESPLICEHGERRLFLAEGSPLDIHGLAEILADCARPTNFNTVFTPPASP